MSQTQTKFPPAAASVLDLFTVLFSNAWIERWHKGWRKTGKPARRFYQRIFSLHVTLWYLIYQRLNPGATLAAVVTDLRNGGADRLGRRGRKLSQRCNAPFQTVVTGG